MITDQEMHDALMFLASTDEESARLYVEMERAEHKAKQVKDAMFLYSTGTIPERQAKASNSDEYKAAQDEYFDASEESRKLNSQRTTKELLIRAWQTVAANRRQGNI